MLIERTHHIHQLLDVLHDYPVVAILGARQVGKTTLSRQLVQHLPEPAHPLQSKRLGRQVEPDRA